MAKLKYKHNTPVVEVLGPRILLSADLPGLDLVSLTPDEPLETDIEKALAEAELNLLSSPSDHSTEIQTTELVLVDTATDGYQQLVDDLLAQTDENRHLEVVLLDSERSGIDQISETLLAYQELDAVHLISHGSDGIINIGNTALNSELLNQSRVEIAAWSKAFSSDGDLLIYGCNLAVSEAGQTFVDALAQLTDADVAASDDLTGHASLGGDWDLEYAQGQIEAKTLIDQDTAEQWHGLLAPPTAADNTISTHEDTTYTFAANDFGYSDADGDAMVSIEITTLETVGALQLSGADVTLNQVITRADIDNDLLTFTGSTDGNGTGYDSFGFSVNDGTSDSVSSYTMTMDLISVNDAPVFTSLDDTPAFTEGGAAQVLDIDVTIADSELDALNDYNGASVTLVRDGGVSTD
ncbi:MAG: DUF4347 domain-containing protein, partial [Desulfobacterales bacterium]|nr:DUF4347 domain-containing protein [Desulfobacterales bacterium]